MIDEFVRILVERLEEEKKYCSYHPHTRDETINKIISIVNQLAEESKDDFCEWIEDMTLSRSAIAHGKFESLSYICKWKYCPYCGKKIKVVE